MFWNCCFPLYPNTSMHLCVRAMTFYMLIIDVNSIKKTISPRKLEEVVMIKFCQKQSFADVLQSGCSEKLRKFHRKNPVLESLPNKVVCLMVCNFVKKRLQHRCFLVKFHKFLRISFLKNTSGDCFWKGSVKDLV